MFSTQNQHLQTPPASRIKLLHPSFPIALPGKRTSLQNWISFNRFRFVEHFLWFKTHTYHCNTFYIPFLMFLCSILSAFWGQFTGHYQQLLAGWPLHSTTSHTSLIDVGLNLFSTQVFLFFLHQNPPPPLLRSSKILKDILSSLACKCIIYIYIIYHIDTSDQSVTTAPRLPALQQPPLRFSQRSHKLATGQHQRNWKPMGKGLLSGCKHPNLARWKMMEKKGGEWWVQEASIYSSHF